MIPLSRHTTALLGAALATFLSTSVALAQDSRKDLKQETKRLALDEMSNETLEKVLSTDERARLLYDNSYGWAAFDNVKVQFAIAGGGGQGVAVVKETGERTYMNMGTAGIGLGIGMKQYQVLFLFETASALDNFINAGWEAEASASATADERGVGAATSFNDGVAYYMLTDNGLMAGADISGTKYWKDGKLN